VSEFVRFAFPVAVVVEVVGEAGGYCDGGFLACASTRGEVHAR
jgi:hypothetical protein